MSHNSLFQIIRKRYQVNKVPVKLIIFTSSLVLFEQFIKSHILSTNYYMQLKQTPSTFKQDYKQLTSKIYSKTKLYFNKIRSKQTDSNQLQRKCAQNKGPIFNRFRTACRDTILAYNQTKSRKKQKLMLNHSLLFAFNLSGLLISSSWIFLWLNLAYAGAYQLYFFSEPIKKRWKKQYAFSDNFSMVAICLNGISGVLLAAATLKLLRKKKI